MKLLYVHQHFSCGFGSQPSRGHSFACALASQGYKVFVICGVYLGGCAGTISPFWNHVRLAFFNGYRVMQFRVLYSNIFFFWRRMVAFLRYAACAVTCSVFNRSDVVIVSSTPLSVLIVMLFQKAFYGSTCIFEVRDRWPELPAAMGAISAEAATLAGWLESIGNVVADMKIALSPSILAGFYRSPKSRKCNFMISNMHFRNISHDNFFRDGILKRNPLEPMAVYFGTHGQANGLRFLLDVAKALLDSKCKVKMLLIGEGMEKRRMLSCARDSGLSNINFFDPLPMKRLREVLKATDVAIHCLANVEQFSEGTSPNKVFEAIGAGLPVVTNCGGWLARRLAETGAGVAVAAHDPRAMAQMLALLTENGCVRMQMSKAAQVLTEKEFAEIRKSSLFCEAVEQCCGRMAV